MCHLVLLLPILALPIFWLLPLPLAIAIYAVIAGLSAWLYYIVVKMMQRTPHIAPELLLGARGEVIHADGSHGLARIGNELWRVDSDHDLQDKDIVRVIARHGLVLRVVDPRHRETASPGAA